MRKNQSSDKEKKRNWETRLVRTLWTLVIGGVLMVFLIFLITSFTRLPSFEDLENPTEDFATEIYFSDNTEMGRFFVKNRVPVTYDEISPNVINALIATEDVRFHRDRKSTRLNSSHVAISYAVFCLRKKERDN